MEKMSSDLYVIENESYHMKYQLKNGAWIEGTQSQINLVRAAMGEFVEDGLHYNSSTHGVMLIANMDDRHLKNAIRKAYRVWVDALNTYDTNTRFAAILAQGPRDITLLGLVNELQKRARH